MLTLRSLARLAGSSPAAVAPTLAKVGWTDLSAGEARNLQFLSHHDERGPTVESDANLVSRGTIEQHILHVLESKINLFELVVGELDMILGRVSDDYDFESRVFDTYVTAENDTEFADRLESLGEELAQARTDYLHNRGAVDALVSEEVAGARVVPVCSSGCTMSNRRAAWQRSEPMALSPCCPPRCSRSSNCPIR